MSHIPRESINVAELFQKRQLVKICAPMVRYSKLQFRTLVRKYNCDVCFTPMILADSFHKSEKARQNEFMTNKCDSPVIVQFAANNVYDFVTSATLASPFCDGVDLNCGCPQRWAKQQGLGCVMLDFPGKIFDITRECRNKINKSFTVSVKMRILDDLSKTVDICRQIEMAGASFLTIHARTPANSTGEINEKALKLIKENVNIPVVANGGIKSLRDCYKLQESVSCDGVMVANGILQNPAVFSGAESTPIQCVQDWVDICYNSTISPLNYNVLEESKSKAVIQEKPSNLTFQCFHHHLVFMLEKIMPKSKRRIFNNLKKFQDVLRFLEDELDVIPKLYCYEDFSRVTPTDLSYEVDSDYSSYDSYLLKEADLNEELPVEYDSSKSDGKYFLSKLSDNHNLQCYSSVT